MPSALDIILGFLAADEHSQYGLRVCHDDAAVTVGDVLGPSHVWIDGECTAEVLGGTSALRLTVRMSPDEVAAVVAQAEEYARGLGGTLALLGCERAEGGEDVGETVMASPSVLAVWDLAHWL